MKRVIGFVLTVLMLSCVLGWSTPACAIEIVSQDDSFLTPDNIPTVEEFLYDRSNGLRLDRFFLSLASGSSESLTLTCKQGEVSDDVFWVTSDRKVAVVQQGEVTGVNFGICTIMARTTDGLRASCTVLVVPEKAVFRTVKKRSAGKISISWQEIDGVSGYQLYRATSEDGTYSKVKTFSDGTTTAFVNTVTRNKTYYYKIRAYYKANDGTYFYGDWSDIASVTA